MSCPRNSQSLVPFFCLSVHSSPVSETLFFFLLVPISEFSSLLRKKYPYSDPLMILFAELFPSLILPVHLILSRSPSFDYHQCVFTWYFLLAFFMTEPIPNPALWLTLSATPVLGCSG